MNYLESKKAHKIAKKESYEKRLKKRKVIEKIRSHNKEGALSGTNLSEGSSIG